MGYNEYELSLPCSAPEAELRAAIARKAKLGDFEYSILLKSLDARHKDRIAWLYRVGVQSPELKDGAAPKAPALEHTRTARGGRVAVAGTGPAGIFAALYLARSGFKVSVLERGSRVDERKAALDAFEAGGPFPAADNYAFGEGGAGTFSDAKLSSRTKGISAEREYLFSEFVAAGAPDEIRYMTHPHVGSDRLYAMTSRLRGALEEAGGSIEFGARVDDIVLSNGKVSALDTTKGRFEADAFVLACGHSSFDTQRMLMKRGVPFRTKNFALGFRAEHEQAAINRAQWGVKSLPGVKAAEYRLTAQSGDTGVYSFCMCPGGTVVPAAAFPEASVVNGKSDYSRAGRWANAAVVAGLSLNALLGEDVSPERALDWLEALERRFKDFAGGWRAPAMTIRDFMAGRSGTVLPPSSYPLGLMSANLAELLPAALVPPLREGLSQFCRKLRGYEDGIILGLESKTSAAIQALRDPEAMTAGYENLYIAGEGSGWSGGIVSSAADGLKAAQALAARF
ncbi:MAG TPA: FAD-dependent oxidoreductase [Spirochaetaceae bacterium]|nr:FAD-dependent oxidoreductase [Spirochaetaceae bacterium]